MLELAGGHVLLKPNRKLQIKNKKHVSKLGGFFQSLPREIIQFDSCFLDGWVQPPKTNTSGHQVIQAVTLSLFIPDIFGGVTQPVVT